MHNGWIRKQNFQITKLLRDHTRDASRCFRFSMLRSQGEIHSGSRGMSKWCNRPEISKENNGGEEERCFAKEISGGKCSVFQFADEGDCNRGCDRNIAHRV